MIRSLALVCATFALASSAEVSPRRTVTLKEGLELAARNSADLAAARAQAAQVESQANRVWGALLPEITASGSVVRTSAPAILSFNQFVTTTGHAYGLGEPSMPTVIPRDLTIIGEVSTYGTLLITETLITPQMVLIPAAKDGVDSARLGVLEAREQVLLNTARIFLSLQGIAQLETAAHEAELVALKREKDATNQLNAGMVVEVALLRAQADTAQARSTLAQLAGQREALLSLLEAFTGEAVRPDEGGAGLDFGAPEPEENQPWENRFLIKSEKKGYDALDAFHTYDRLLWMPTLSAQAKGNYNSNLGFTGQHFSYDLALMLTFPIYDRGARYSAMHEDDAKAAEQLAKLDSTRRQAKATWVGAKSNLQAAQAASDLAQAQLQLSTRAQKQLESAYQAGVVTSLELSDIDNKRFLAASSAAQAKAQVEVRKMEIAAAEGRLAQVAGLK